MYGKDRVMAQAYPCLMDPYLLAVRDEGCRSAVTIFQEGDYEWS